MTSLIETSDYSHDFNCASYYLLDYSIVISQSRRFTWLVRVVYRLCYMCSRFVPGTVCCGCWVTCDRTTRAEATRPVRAARHAQDGDARAAVLFDRHRAKPREQTLGTFQAVPNHGASPVIKNTLSDNIYSPAALTWLTKTITSAQDLLRQRHTDSRCGCVYKFSWVNIFWVAF